ncbi:hypothetical protein EIN_026210 [Entamoeba invadens IP1]|uniref:hypothetical protein n=1 Tax=Entamoeba invadens IP1 TaxID=370355 RepID=UPI0002C3F57D|nr:hypothetical protein EIN_026210 [Entamoeba invadens IP1]ELP90772.1 hypothetical protein EIN_026210 [Entamoeba invadens IP1]|eukprot:XP_004257543.1 hypothetical protein EIN_026210 [Entamoeba invadens IP1]
MQTSQHPVSRKSLCGCCICRKSGYFNVPSPKIKNTRLCVLILQALKEISPIPDYFNLKNDIYVFVEDHWDILYRLPILQKQNWKKALLDAFNHCTYIESGKDLFRNRGYYRLKTEKVVSEDEDMENMKVVVSMSIKHLRDQLNNNISVLQKFGDDEVAFQHIALMQSHLTVFM